MPAENAVQAKEAVKGAEAKTQEKRGYAAAAPIVQIRSINKFYGNFQALNDVSLDIMQGEVFGLIGPNGAGKSTLAKIMTGLGKADSGTVNFSGAELTANYDKIKGFIAIVPQETSFFYSFTVEQNLKFFGAMYGLTGAELQKRTDYLIEWLGLSSFRKRQAENLSGGYKRLLNIACSLVNNPKVIFMDEPTVGLDPKVREHFWEKIFELKHQGKTICITTHYMDEAEHLCNRIGLISDGKVLLSGTPQELIASFGGVKVLVVKLNKVPEKIIVDAIKGTLKGSDVNAAGNYLIISFLPERALEKIASITEWLVKEGYEIVSSRIKEPDLEDVFMNVTGQQLRN